MAKGPDPINSFIGEGTLFKGEINASGSLFINGQVEGLISIEGDVFVGEKGKVVGNVIGAKVVVSGHIVGDITAKMGLEITKNGNVEGEITCDKLIIEDGSAYKGRVHVGKGS